MGTGDFLSRWSRRKQETRLPPAEPLPAEVSAAEARTETEPAEPELTPEELAALPSLEAIDIGTDVTQFLRAGVPRLLRNAALRRMWSLDPAIRDYLCEAREYAYDWNVPGGVPGAGPLLPTDDVKAMLARIMGDPPDAEPEAAAEPDPGTAEAVAPAEEAQPMVTQEAVPAPEVAPVVQAAPEAANEESRQRPASVTRVRRHGGAIPL